MLFQLQETMAMAYSDGQVPPRDVCNLWLYYNNCVGGHWPWNLNPSLLVSQVREAVPMGLVKPAHAVCLALLKV